MKKDTLILTDGTTIVLEAGASLSALVVMHASIDAFARLYKKLTPDNLSNVTIKNGDDVVVATYNAKFINVTVSTVSDGIRASYNLSEKTDVDLRLDELESTQEDQDEAITELAEIVAE